MNNINLKEKTFGSLNERNYSFDLLKTLAAFLVVYIHTAIVDSSIVLGVIKAIARIAVPLFLMISGYYYVMLCEKNSFWKHMRKILNMTIAFTFLYFVGACFLHVRNGDFVLFLSNRFTIKHLLVWIVLNVSYFGHHLWYMWAVLYALLFLWIVDRLNLRHVFYVSIPFLILANYALSFQAIALFYRNFLFIGIPYVGIGCLLYEYRNNIIKVFQTVTEMKLLAIILFLCFLQCVELFVYFKSNLLLSRDHYLMTLPFCLSLFGYAMAYPSRGKDTCLSIIGERYSAYIYGFHIMLIPLVSYVLRYLGLEVGYNYYISIFVFVFSLLVSWMYLLGKKYLLKRKVSVKKLE
jgi:acyltransferase 3